MLAAVHGLAWLDGATILIHAGPPGPLDAVPLKSPVVTNVSVVGLPASICVKSSDWTTDAISMLLCVTRSLYAGDNGG